MVAWNVKKIDRPLLFLKAHPGWHDISDICKECRMTRNEVSLALRNNSKIERKYISKREMVIGAYGFWENSGTVNSTVYRVVADA